MFTAQCCAGQNDVAERMYILRALASVIPGLPDQDIDKYVYHTMVPRAEPNAAELLKREAVSTQYFSQKLVTNFLPPPRTRCNVRYRCSRT